MTHVRVALGILLACLAWSCWRGQDVNWDLQNYHLYDAFALLHWRGARDAMPAGPQTYLNPLPYLLPYAARRLLPPLAAGLVIAASQCLALILAWGIAWTIRRRLPAALLATLVASTGAVTLIELGTSFADLSLTIPPLASILLLLRRATLPQRGAPAGLILAGALTGIAIGMKPTSLFLLPALLAFAAMLQSGWGDGARAAALTLAGAIAGGLISDGAWALHLWLGYGSPMFPFMNRVFRSHSAALVDFGDHRFRFQGIGHALAIPFLLAYGSAATGEVPIRDARLAVACCLAAFRLVSCIASRRRPDALDAACAYILIGLAGWLVLCPIERYAATLEILCGLLAILLLEERVARLSRGVPAAAILAAATLLIVSSTRPANFFHRSWSDPGRLRVPEGVARGATYGLLGVPLGDWVTARPSPVASFDLVPTLLETGGVLQRRVDRIIHASGSRLWLLSLDEPIPAQVRAEMRIHGIVQAPPCLRAASLYWIDTVFCHGVPSGPRPFAASDLAPGAKIAFSLSGDGLIYEVDGFIETGPDATWAIGSTSHLAIHLDSKTQASGGLLLLDLAGLAFAGDRHVTVSASGARLWTVRLGAPTYFGTAALCIRPHAGTDGTVVVSLATDHTQSAATLRLGTDPRPLSFKLYSMRLHPGPC